MSELFETFIYLRDTNTSNLLVMAQEKVTLITEFLEKMGLSYTVNSNPTSQEIQEIEASYKDKEIFTNALTYLAQRKHPIA